MPATEPEYDDRDPAPSMVLILAALAIVVAISVFALEQRRACERQSCLTGLPQLVDGECLCLQELP
jgi:hypothetical protein